MGHELMGAPYEDPAPFIVREVPGRFPGLERRLTAILSRLLGLLEVWDANHRATLQDTGVLKIKPLLWGCHAVGVPRCGGAAVPTGGGGHYPQQK